MECRTILAVPEADRLTVWSGHQMPHRLRRELAAVLGWSIDRIRVVVPDTGGAFGCKSAAFPESVVVAHLAVKLGRPVRWIDDRLESMLVATRGRGQDQTVRLAADAEGQLLAYELTVDADIGAYPHLGAGLPMQTAWMATGAYTTPRVHATLRSVLTNTMVTYPYRGAGRPEAAIAIERTMDLLARRLGIDPIELRRRNFIPPDAFPYETPTGRRYLRTRTGSATTPPADGSDVIAHPTASGTVPRTVPSQGHYFSRRFSTSASMSKLSRRFWIAVAPMWPSKYFPNQFFISR